MKFVSYVCVINLVVILQVSAQSHRVSVVDFIKVKNNHYQEALYFYQNNWKVFREVARKQNYVQSFTFFKSVPPDTSKFDFLLITSYSDSTDRKSVV